MRRFQADIHGGSAELCWLHFYSDAGRKVANASQAIAMVLCSEKRGDSLLKCMEQQCACNADTRKEVCEKKTQRCTESALVWRHFNSVVLTLASLKRVTPVFAGRCTEAEPPTGADGDTRRGNFPNLTLQRVL